MSEPTNTSRDVNVTTPGPRNGPRTRTKDTPTWPKEGRTSPASLLVTPCYGKPALFDSVEIEDHRAARAICETCPIIANCMMLLAEVKRAGGSHGQPEGTWAGQLERPKHWQIDRTESPIRRKIRIEDEDERYAGDKARQAHAAYIAGDKSEWARVGHRTYQRNVKRAARKKAA